MILIDVLAIQGLKKVLLRNFLQTRRWQFHTVTDIATLVALSRLSIRVLFLRIRSVHHSQMFFHFGKNNFHHSPNRFRVCATLETFVFSISSNGGRQG